jgi:hypothetical protein
MRSPEEIEQQRGLLAAHRRTLAHLLSQQAQFSAGHIPAHIANGINETRMNIGHIKIILREWGVEAEDHPNDEEVLRFSSSISSQMNPEKLYSEAMRSYLTGDLGLALQLFLQVQQIDPHYPRLLARIREIEKELQQPHVDRSGRVKISWRLESLGRLLIEFSAELLRSLSLDKRTNDENDKSK